MKTATGRQYPAPGTIFFFPWNYCPWGQVCCLVVLLFLASGAGAQDLQWNKTYGGTNADFLTCLQQTRDGGYLLGGYSFSDRGGDKSQDTRGDCLAGDFGFPENDCQADYWVVKLDSAGNKQWDKTFGGDGDDRLQALQQTRDGAYLIAGTSYSPRSGDKSQDSLGSADFWVLRLDSAGNKVWDKTFGGRGSDALTCLELSRDGGFLLGGNSFSGIGGHKSEANRASCPPEKRCTPDFWVLKLDAQGNLQWDKTIGGRAEDDLAALRQTRDGGYALAGFSSSGRGGDKTARKRGSADYWLVKLDSKGRKSWDKSYGSSTRNLLQDMQLTRDGGFILGGYTASGRDGDVSGPFYGDSDYWIIKLDAEGKKSWDKTYGARDPDYFTTLVQTREGGYLLAGTSYSPLGFDKTWAKTGGWLIKTDKAGNKQWDKVFGTSGRFTSLIQTRDGAYVLGGSPRAGISDEKSDPGRGAEDYWIAKIEEGFDPVPLKLHSFSPKAGFPGSMVVLQGENLFKTASVWFHGAKLKKAKYTIQNNHTLVTWVPQPAKTGPITLFSAEGAVVSSDIFQVLHPSLASFSPGQGQAGTVVRLIGQNLATTREVYFNGVRALNYKVASNQEVTALVPAGASTGKISLVLAQGQVVVSQQDFSVLPAQDLAGARQDLSRQDGQPDTETSDGLARIRVFPNPFRQELTFQFTLNQSQQATVKVYDLLGREVKVLFQGEARAAQPYQALWRPSGRQAAGVYYIRLQAAGQSSQLKVLLDR